MLRHTSLNLDDDLIDLAKTIGGRGIISTLCNDTLKAFVYGHEDSANLTKEDKARIAYVREVYNRINGEKEIIRDCWEHFIKPQLGPTVARYGLRKKTMEAILESAKEWMFERYNRLPTDEEIEETFRELYRREYYYWQGERAIAHQAKWEMERESQRTADEFNTGLAAWQDRITNKAEPPAELPHIAEVSNGRV